MAKRTFKTFKVIGASSTAISWELPMKNVMANRKNEGGGVARKRIHYIPGVESPWVEDYEGDEKAPKLYFENEGLGCVRKVYDDEVALLFCIYNHPWYGKKFEQVDGEITAQKELDNFDLIDKANARIDIADDVERKAAALVLLGQGAMTLTTTKVKAALKKKAHKEPKLLLAEMNKADYQARYVGALAILREVLEINPSRTAVIWKNTGKTLINVAVGQDPVTKLGEFLAANTEQSKNTMQEIGIQSKRAYVKKKPVDIVEEIDKVNPEAAKAPEQKPEEQEQEEQEQEEEQEEMTIEEARIAFMRRFDKPVPNNKKNDLLWISNRLGEE